MKTRRQLIIVSHYFAMVYTRQPFLTECLCDKNLPRDEERWRKYKAKTLQNSRTVFPCFPENLLKTGTTENEQCFHPGLEKERKVVKFLWNYAHTLDNKIRKLSQSSYTEQRKKALVKTAKRSVNEAIIIIFTSDLLGLNQKRNLNFTWKFTTPENYLVKNPLSKMKLNSLYLFTSR